MFEQAWEETLMALRKEPEEDPLDSLHQRQLEKSTPMQNALALWHSDQVHRKEPKSYSKLKDMVTDVLEDQLVNISKKQGRLKDSNPSRTTEEQR